VSHSVADIRRQAGRLLQRAGVLREPVSLRDVVGVLNLEVAQAAREPFSCEAAPRPLGDRHAMVLHGSSGERRRRFTIAHEVGHFVLHPGRLAPERGGAVSIAWQLQEREADRFAAELLMPESLVREAVLENGGDADRLADRFEVSRRAMQARLRELGLAARRTDSRRQRRSF